ncbi:MAG: hypothetical protein AAF533_05905 [Acidobacteriota bacterium]
MRRWSGALLLLSTVLSFSMPAWAGLDFTPTHEWTWADPNGHELRVTPVVARQGTCGPAVIAVSYRPVEGAGGYRIALVDENGTTINPDLGRTVYAETVALADMVGQDGIPEILAVTWDDDFLVCWELDGTERWIGRHAVPNALQSTLGVADFDCDDIPEMFVGSSVFDGGTRGPVPGAILPGDLFFTGSAGTGRPGFASHTMSHAVDLDSDGCLELLAGNSLYRPRDCGGGTGLLWDASVHGVPDGYTAVGDFIGDDGPEIMLVGNLTGSPAAWLLSPTGAVLGTSVFNGVAGPETSTPIALELDGDDKAEFALAHVGNGTGSPTTVMRTGEWVFDTSGNAIIVERTPIPVDDGTGASAPTAFDFDADGVDEIVHADEARFLILEAGNTTPLADLSRGSHGTRLEHPVVVQLDDDPHAEIIIVHDASDPADPSDDPVHDDVAGMSVYEIVGSDAPRAVWNQHAYHVDHATESADIPCEAKARPWATHGTWMAQVPACQIDFELGELPAGTVVTNQFLPQGVLVQSMTNQVVVFDTANAACDPDLETPSPTSATDNRVPRDRVLILMERESPCLPADDEDDGGLMTFTFTTPRDIDAIGLLDIDDRDATYVYVSTASGPYTFTADMLEDNSYQRLDIGLECVGKIIVDFGGSGAVTNIFCGQLDSDIQHWDASF